MRKKTKEKNDKETKNDKKEKKKTDKTKTINKKTNMSSSRTCLKKRLTLNLFRFHTKQSTIQSSCARYLLLLLPPHRTNYVAGVPAPRPP